MIHRISEEKDPKKRERMAERVARWVRKHYWHQLSHKQKADTLKAMEAGKPRIDIVEKKLPAKPMPRACQKLKKHRARVKQKALKRRRERKNV